MLGFSPLATAPLADLADTGLETGITSLAPGSVIGGAGEVTAPALTQKHNFHSIGTHCSAPGITSSALSETHGLVIADVTADSLRVADPLLSQDHYAQTGNVNTTPAVDTSELRQTHNFSTNKIESDTPKVAALTAAVTTALSALDVEATPRVSLAYISHRYILDTADLAVEPTSIARPGVSLTTSVNPNDVTTGSSAVDEVTFSQVFNLIPANMNAAPVSMAPVPVSQEHHISPAKVLTLEAEVDPVGLSGANHFVPSNLSSGTPSLALPVLTPNWLFSTQSVTSKPYVGRPQVTQTETLVATNVSPLVWVATARLNQHHEIELEKVTVYPPPSPAATLVSDIRTAFAGMGPNFVTLTDTRNSVQLNYHYEEVA